MTGEPPLEKPSRFWQSLATDHADVLKHYGPDSIKRRQALRYFTWRWSWRSIASSVQMRFLLAHTSPSALVRCAIEPPRLDDDAWRGVPWNRGDRWLYTFAVRLLWEYAARHDTYGVLALEEPLLGGPLPVFWRGRLISQDLANTALEATAIGRALAGRRPRSILEIGAGYGRTAYALLHAFPEATYTVVDIEPALSISRWYLTQLFPPELLRFRAPSEARRLGTSSADLVVAISSLHEMTPAQISDYLQLVDRVGTGGRVYLKQWERWKNPADGVTVEFERYPVPRRWRRIFDEPAPVQTNFRQAAWEVPGAGPSL